MKWEDLITLFFLGCIAVLVITHAGPFAQAAGTLFADIDAGSNLLSGGAGGAFPKQASNSFSNPTVGAQAARGVANAFPGANGPAPTPSGKQTNPIGVIG